MNTAMIALGQSTQPPSGLRLRAAQDRRPFRQDLLAAAAVNRSALQDAAEKLVSSALILPAFSSLSQSPLRPRTGPFAASTVEKRFGPLLHQHFADGVARASHFGLSSSIVARFARRSTTESGVVA